MGPDLFRVAGQRQAGLLDPRHSDPVLQPLPAGQELQCQAVLAIAEEVSDGDLGHPKGSVSTSRPLGR